MGRTTLGHHHRRRPSRGTQHARAREAGAPEADAAGLETTGTPASYDTSDYPTQLDLLHRLYAHHPHMPLWYEVPHKDTSVIEYTPLNRPVAMGVATDGILTITDRTPSPQPSPHHWWKPTTTRP